jgi:hypothetical protein
MPLPSPINKAQWIQLASLRIERVLSQRTAANIRQLEVKICESGPADKRPNPHILTTALHNLLRTNVVRTIKPQGEKAKHETIFYTLTKFYPEPATTRVNALLVPYRTHRMLTEREEWCSQVLEGIVSSTFRDAGGNTPLGKIPPAAPLDGVYRFHSDTIGCEVKNVREWIYPESSRIWTMVKKCLQIDALPFLVARKLPYVTLTIFSHLGIMGYQIHNQYFSPLVASLLTDIRHTDSLGYKDVSTSDPNQSHPSLLKFLQVLPKKLPTWRATWDDKKELLHTFAVTKDLANPALPQPKRDHAYKELSRVLFPPEEEIEEFGAYDDY